MDSRLDAMTKMRMMGVSWLYLVIVDDVVHIKLCLLDCESAFLRLMTNFLLYLGCLLAYLYEFIG